MCVSRLIAAAALAALATMGSAAPVPAERAKAEKEMAALKVKLLGGWMGDAPCQGRLLIHADGKYEWLDRGPGGESNTGVWNLRGDARRTTLTLACQDADDPAEVGQTTEVKLVHLDGTGLAFESAEESRPLRFFRMKKDLLDP